MEKTHKLQSFLIILLVSFSLLNSASGQELEPDWKYFKNGSIHMILSSHQDIAWMNSPDECIKWRDLRWITPSLQLLKDNPQYYITMEDVRMLKEYLERHPEKKKEIIELTREGRLEWGGTYNQPYEGLESGEQLIRQVYFGKKWLKKTLPGCDTWVAYSPDVPGRTMQMPQILKKAGIKYLYFSRFKEGIYKWYSPDDSYILASSTGHYGSQIPLFDKDYNKTIENVCNKLKKEDNYYRKHKLPNDYLVYISSDFSKPGNYNDLFSTWNINKEWPKFKYSTLSNFFQEIDKPAVQFETLKGENPNLWLYIHGPTHHWAVSAKRDAGRLLTSAEIFSSINSVLSGSFKDYPAKELTEAWGNSIYPDHGWGGYEGDITDFEFRRRLKNAKKTGQILTDKALRSISAKINTDITKGIPLVVFNQLSWKRSEPVIYDIPSMTKNFKIADWTGNEINFQHVYNKVLRWTTHKDQIVFVAEDIPPMGYKTYYFIPVNKNKQKTNNRGNNITTYENQFYKIEMAPGGIKSLYDKTLNKEILITNKFLGGEVFTMHSEGNGAGEFTDVQAPTMEDFSKMSDYNPEWELVENGPVRKVFYFEKPYKNCTVFQKCIIYDKIKKISFDITLYRWDGSKNIEYRVAFPINMEDDQVAYEVPLGVVNVGKDEIDRAPGFAYGRVTYATPARDVHPREVQNFISTYNNKFSVTLSTSVAVCDYIDPTIPSVDYPILQPILLASRRSCNGRGNWYQQPGDHHYQFHFTSDNHAKGSNELQGISANYPLKLLQVYDTEKDAFLPEEKCFVNIDSENVIVSTLKKCEDDNNLILRAYEIKGKDVKTQFKFDFPMSKVTHTNIIEEDKTGISTNTNDFIFDFGHHAIETFKIQIKYNFKK